MKHIAIALTLFLTLPGCATLSPPTSIGQVRLTTIQAATAVNDTYATLSETGARLVKAGLLNRERFMALDAEAYAIVLKVRRAKEAGDTAFDYATALQAVIAINKDLVK